MNYKKNKLLVTTLILSFLFSLNAFANQSVDSKKDDLLSMAGLSRIVDQLLLRMPNGKVKCAIDTYMDILKPSSYKSNDQVAEDNVGMALYFQNVLNNSPCFSKIASNFYFSTLPEYLNNISLSNQYPSLADEPEQGTYKSVQSGTLWNMAMDASNKNALAAMHLLALCSATATPLKCKISARQAEKELRRSLDATQKALDHHKETKSAMDQSKEKNDVYQQYILGQIKQDQEKIATIKASLESPEKPAEIPLQCNLGAFSLPKGLGAEVDIDKKLKLKISELYDKKPSDIYSKMYHVMTAAFMGCALASKCGISNQEAAFVEKMAAFSYRSITLCNQTRDFLAKKQKLEDVFDEPYRNIQNITSAENTARICADPNFSNLCNNPQNKNANIQELIRNIDTYILYRKWYLGGGSILGINLPCTNIAKPGIQDLSRIESKLIQGLGSCGISCFTKERCNSAQKGIARWNVDFEWTMKQHEVGAKFGANQCSSSESNITMEAKMCSFLSSEKPLDLKSKKSQEVVQ